MTGTQTTLTNASQTAVVQFQVGLVQEGPQQQLQLVLKFVEMEFELLLNNAMMQIL